MNSEKTISYFRLVRLLIILLSMVHFIMRQHGYELFWFFSVLALAQFCIQVFIIAAMLMPLNTERIQMISFVWHQLNMPASSFVYGVSRAECVKIKNIFICSPHKILSFVC